MSLRLSIKNYISSDQNKWLKVRYATIVFFLFSAGMETARNARDSYFLTKVGASEIPKMYIAMAVLMLIASCIYGIIVDKIRRDTLLNGIAYTGFISFLILWIIIHFNLDSKYMPYFVFCFVEAYITFTIMHFWNYFMNIFDPTEGKKIFPILGATCLTGAMTGGLITKLFSSTIGADFLFLFFGISLISLVPMVYKLRKIMKFSGHSGDTILEVEDEDVSLGIESILQIWKIPLIRTLTYMTFPLWLIIYTIEFYYYGSMNKVYPNQNDLAGFLGLFGFSASFIGLFFQLTITPVLIRKLGVGATSLIYPFALTLGAVSLFFFSLFPSASEATSFPLFGIVLFVIFSRLMDIAIYYSVYDSTNQLIFYAIPANLQSKARTFIIGIIAPSATIISGALLIYFSHTNEPVYSVAFIALVCSFGLLIFGIKLTPDYLKAMFSGFSLQSTQQKDELFNEIKKLQETDVRYVLMDILTSDSEQDSQFAIKRLFQKKDDALLEDIEEIFDQLSPIIMEQIRSYLTQADYKNYPGITAT